MTHLAHEVVDEWVVRTTWLSKQMTNWADECEWESYASKVVTEQMTEWAHETGDEWMARANDWANKWPNGRMTVNERAMAYASEQANNWMGAWDSEWMISASKWLSKEMTERADECEWESYVSKQMAKWAHETFDERVVRAN